jgi:DNA repair exonuclease SbcCD ATPase subunit
MFSYGEKNVIDFTKVKDLVGLFAANASGKSSLFSALTFCLFDKCEREYKAANIMNTQKTEFMCKFEFEIDRKRYFIERIGKADKKGKVKVDVKFWKLEGDQEVDLNGEQRKDTNEIIREYLGSYDDFVLTSLSVQNGKNNASIIDMGDTDRKDLFAQFMGLTIFDRLHTEANERLRERLVLMRAYKNDDYTQKLVDYTNLLEQAEGFYKNMTTELERATQERNGIQEKVVEATKKLIPIDVDLPPLSVINTIIRKAEQIVAQYKDKCTTQEAEIKTVAGRLEAVELEIKKLDDKELSKTNVYRGQLQSKLNQLDYKKADLKKSYESDVKIVNRALTLEYDPNCPFCVKNSGKIATDAEEATKRLDQIKLDIIDLKTQFEETEAQLKETDWCDKACYVYNDLLRERNKLKDSQLQSTTKLASLHKELAKFEDEVKTQEKNIELYHKNKESVETNVETNKEISALKTELNNSDFIIKKMNASILDINSKVSVCKNNIDTINRKIDEIKKVESEYKLYEAYCKAVSRDGIPFDVITATVPSIESEVNNILGQICDFSASFETDGKNVIPYIVYDDKKWLMSLTSGFEKFALSLAIRVALIYVSNLPRPNFLIIDEGMSVMDGENLSSLPLLFSYLKTRFEFVLIVSHLDSVRDMVDSYIELKKENGFSKIEYI